MKQVLFHTLASYTCCLQFVSCPSHIPLTHTHRGWWVGVGGRGRAGQEHDDGEHDFDPTAAGSGQQGGQQDSLRRKGGRQAGKGAAPQVVAVFGLSVFVVVALLFACFLFF